jgi:predicted Zn finger-like uncharacterized protein
MEITCPKCATVFQLNDSLLPPEGGWVRCTRCQEVFLAEKAAPQLDNPPPLLNQDQPGLMRGAPPSLDHGPMADFGLGEEEEEPTGPGKRGFLRFLFFLIMLLVILSAVGTGGLVALDRLKLMPQWVAPFRELPLFNLVLTQNTAAEGGLSLNNVRGYYRDNQHVGRILVIQGEVLNTSDHSLVRVLVMGRVNDIRNNPARQATIYAGPVFTPEQLRVLTLQEIQSRLSQPQDSQGGLYELPAKGTLPFMIVLANLPDNIADYTADVVGWENRPPGGR